MLTPRLPLSRAEWSFEVQWIVATVAGWIIGFTLCELIKEAVNAFIYYVTHLHFSTDGLIIGVSVGIAQYIALRRMKGARWWIFASVAGYGIGKFLGDEVAGSTPSVAEYFLGGAVIGVCVGILQHLTVLRINVARSGWWLLASALAWAVGWPIINLVNETNSVTYLVGVMGSALAGLISGIGLIWLQQLSTQSVVSSG